MVLFLYTYEFHIYQFGLINHKTLEIIEHIVKRNE